MDRADLVDLAEALIDEYRQIFAIDPYFKIKIELLEGDFVSRCNEDIIPACWVLQLNSDRHVDLVDIQTSVIDCLIRIITRDLPSSKKLDEIISRLSYSFVNIINNISDVNEEAGNGAEEGEHIG